MLQDFKKELHKLANEEKAKILQGFFKTGKGEYGEGDIFLGISVPIQRKLIKNYFKDFSFEDIQILLDSDIHEERFCGVISLVEKYKIGDNEVKKEIFEFYLKNAKKINNWDLVDLSAPNIVGDFLWNYKKEDLDFSGFPISREGQKEEFELIDFSTSSKGQKKQEGQKEEFILSAGFPLSREGQENKGILYKLAKSENLWERRISIISTFYFIRKGDFEYTLKIVDILITDKHDLIQKACGWMLREIGKRDEKVLTYFLDKYYKIMPRTMLRYSIERLEEEKKKSYLGK